MIIRQFHRRFLGCFVGLGLFLNLGLSTVLAQVSQGSVSGRVTDSTGAVVPGVSVTLVNEGTGIERESVSNDSGRYLFPTVAPGKYAIRAELPGFKTYVARAIEVQVAHAVTQDIQLEVGERTDQIEVTASAPVLERRSGAVGQVIGVREVQDLPLNGRDFVDLAKLVPGVTQFARSFQSTGISINGLRGNQVSFYFDGVDTRTEFNGNTAFRPSVEAIQEFKIQQNSFSAEFGRLPAAINLSLKSGTNKIHGSLFEFVRNDKLDARSFFARERDVLRRNQFGFVVDGPIIRNRTFYMVNFEGLRTRRTATIFANLPTPEQLSGDFSKDNPIFDPLTLDPKTGKRQQFPNNKIPDSRIGLIGRAAAKFYPRPNLEGVTGFNFINTVPRTNDADQFHVRLDHKLSERDELFGRYSYSRNDALTPSGLPLTGNISESDSRSLVVQNTHTFGPDKIMQFRMSWTFFEDFIGFPLADRPLATEEFGLKNLNPPTTAFGLPQIVVPGLRTIGADPFRPFGGTENAYTAGGDFDWILGDHHVKFGGEWRYFRPAQFVQLTPNGILTFQNQFTTQPGVRGTGSPVADLVLGFPFSGRGTQLVESSGSVSLKYHYWGFYVQDEIQLLPNLTANLGLRYEYQTPFKERFDDIFVFDFVNGRFLEPGKDIKNLHRADKNNFAPRIGLAYSTTPKTVLRAGFGVFYGVSRAKEFSSFQLSPPFVVDATLFSAPLIPDLPGKLFPKARVRDPQTGEVLLTPNTNVFALDPGDEFRTNYTYQWNLNIQRELARNWLLEVGYLGNSAHKLLGRDLVNQAFLDPNPLNPTPVNTRRPNPNIGDVNLVKALDNSNYHALAVKVNKRFSEGFSLLGSYTYSKTLGIGGTIFGDQSTCQDCRNRRAEFGPLEFNQKQRLTLAWIYQLPFGRNLSGPLGALVGGWSFQGIYTAHSGFPLTPTDRVSANIGRADRNRPDRICDGNLDDDARSLTRWFDTSCFVSHPFGRFGNSGEGVTIGPGLNNFDLTLMKDFRIPIGFREEPLTLQYRAEFFNAFNHAQFGDPGLGVGTPQFGVIRSTRMTGREMQMSLKLLF